VLHYLARSLIASPSLTIACSRLQIKGGRLPLEGLCHGSKQRTMRLSCEEFLRRFLQHVLPGVPAHPPTSDGMANYTRER